MKLKIEQEVKAFIEINGESFISSEESLVYQNTDNPNEILMYIKSKNDSKEIKIKITKNQQVNDED